MTVRQIERIIEVAKEPHVHGKWSRFCLSEGVTKDAVFHWRKKLGLPLKPRRTSDSASSEHPK